MSHPDSQGTTPTHDRWFDRHWWVFILLAVVAVVAAVAVKPWNVWHVLLPACDGAGSPVAVGPLTDALEHRGFEVRRTRRDFVCGSDEPDDIGSWLVLRSFHAKPLHDSYCMVDNEGFTMGSHAIKVEDTSDYGVDPIWDNRVDISHANVACVVHSSKPAARLALGNEVAAAIRTIPEEDVPRNL